MEDQIESQEFAWDSINIDDADQVRTLRERYHLDEEVIGYSLDPNEGSHVEYNAETKQFLMVYSIPQHANLDTNFETTPITFVITPNNQLLVISSKEAGFVIDKLNRRRRLLSGKSAYSCLFDMLFTVTESYFPIVESANTQRTKISADLRKKTTKEGLIALSDLGVGLVYLVSSARRNLVVLEQLRLQTVYREMNDFERERLDDVIIEARQVVEQTSLASQILEQVSGMFNNILNNNLNDTIKVFTVISLVLTVPNIVYGFFGMNLKLPFMGTWFGSAIVFVISVLLCVALYYLFLRHRMK
jgi:Mg2+ and Co2+ transporter CorA